MENNSSLPETDLIQILGISRSKAYGLMRRKEEPIIQINKRVRV
jgi:predicted DNA-binding transcriptional regulator AlpA